MGGYPIPRSVVDNLKFLCTEEVAVRLGFKVVRHKMCCFAHAEKNASLGFYGPELRKWHCFSCGKGGDNAINFVMECCGLKFVDACRKLCELYGMDCGGGMGSYGVCKPVASCSSRDSEKGTEKDSGKGRGNVFHSEVAQWILDNTGGLTPRAENFLFRERKLNRDVIVRQGVRAVERPWKLLGMLKERFDMGVLSESCFIKKNDKGLFLKFFSPCLLFPYYNAEGVLMGVQSRYLGQDKEVPRFQFFFGGDKKTCLYNLPVLKSICPGDDLYIAEGITDCLAMLSDGLNAVAIPSANIIPAEDLDMLDGFRLHIGMDNDRAGKMAAGIISGLLDKKGICHDVVVLPDVAKDYGGLVADMRVA